MTTANNYFVEVARIGVNTLPDALKKGHDLVVRSTSNGTNWDNYHNSENIRKVIDLYFQKLNEYANTLTPKQTSQSSLLKPAPPKKTRDPKPKQKKAQAIREQKNIKQVEHIGEEVKFIKRYVGLHNKVKSPNAILTLIRSLQRSIVQKLIRKSSPLAKEIEMIQTKLVQAYNKMKGEEAFVINEKDLSQFVAIAGGEKVYQSITAIKRFIGLQGKDDQKKINSFIKYLENLVEKKKLTKDDPYADKVNAIYKSLRQRTSTKVSVSKAELNGLQGIVRTCGCKNHNTKPSKTRSAYSRNKGLSGVLTAEEMATRQLDLLTFTSFWHSLLGNPARNFTMMFHGEPHNGKTIFLLKLAQYLAESFGEVLFVSSEEFASPTMTKKVNEFLNPLPSRLHFAENLKDPDLSKYQFIVMDSVNDLGLKINEYKELRKKHPDKAFIFILQHTKAGDFRGGKDWEHTAEIVGEVRRGKVSITKNRYAPKTSQDFFKQFGLQWQEPNDVSTPKPSQVREDFVTTGNTHF